MAKESTKENSKIKAITAIMEQYTEMTVWIAAAKAANAQYIDCEPPFNVDVKIIKVRSIRDFVTSLPDSREKLFLHYHYISGMSMEKTAELLSISPRTAYRLRLRALDYAARIYFGNRRIKAG